MDRSFSDNRILECSAFIQNAYLSWIGCILHSNHFIKCDEEHIVGMAWNSLYYFSIFQSEQD